MEGRLIFLEQAEALGYCFSFVMFTYITNILLRVISWIIDTSRKRFLILVCKGAFLHEMGRVC